MGHLNALANLPRDSGHIRPQSLFGLIHIKSRKTARDEYKDLQDRIEAELDEASEKERCGVLDCIKAETFHSFLYAQDDKYP